MQASTCHRATQDVAHHRIRVQRCAFLQVGAAPACGILPLGSGVDDDPKRPVADPAVAALVDGALARAGGDAERAVDLLLRVEQDRPEDASVGRAVELLLLRLEHDHPEDTPVWAMVRAVLAARRSTARPAEARD